MFALLQVTATAQDFEPSQKLFMFNGDSTYLSAKLPYFRQRNMLIGWHWGGPELNLVFALKKYPIPIFLR
jgi:hypothetical protein